LYHQKNVKSNLVVSAKTSLEIRIKKTTNTSEELQNLLNTEVPIVVVETGKTPIIDSNSGSDSDNLSPLPNTEVLTITNLEFINTLSNQASRHKNSRYAAPRFLLCCTNSKVQLLPLLEPPPYLLNLYTSTNSDAVEFHKHARDYNIYHLIGSLLPNKGQTSAFAQIYIYDTANEITNCYNIMQELNENILQSLQNINRNQDIRCYNTPSASNVAAIMVGDGHKVNPTNRDILLRMCDRNLQKIAEVYPSYNPFHYVLLFPKGDD
ncbi:12841_t:CDS:2, partial [Dentiscutata erythropus]